MTSLRAGLLLFLVTCSHGAEGKDWKALRRQIRDTLHISRPLSTSQEKLYGSFSPAANVSADRVSYATGYGLRIPAIVYHPAKRRRMRRPALVIVNGHGGDKSSWYAYWAGILYARAGAVVLTYDPIGEFERNHLRESGTSQHDPYIAPDDMARRMGRANGGRRHVRRQVFGSAQGC
jgi:hypothetical protein